MATAFKLKPKFLVRALVQALGAGLLLHAGGAAAISLEQAYQAALQNDPSYRAAFYANEGGKENRILGRAGLLPNLSGSYSTNRNRADITQGLSTRHPDYNSQSANLSLRQSIFNFDAIARYKQGIAQSNTSAAQFDTKGQELILRLVGAYIEALYANDQLALVEAQRDMLIEQSKVNDRLFQKGEGTRTDMLETQARLDLAEAKVLEAKDAQLAARTTLAGIIGAEVSSLDSLRPDFRVRPADTVSFEQWKAIALERNPDLKAGTYAIEVAHQEMNRARSGHLPRLDFVASYARNDSETINTLNQESTVRSVGLQLNIPLYAGGSVNAATRQAVAGRERAKADLQAATDKVLVDMRKSYDSVASSVSRIDALVKAVESAKLLMKATEQSIKGGVRINLDLLNAQEQLYTAQRDLAQARYTYLLGSLRLRAAAGTLSAGDVREVASNFR